MLRFWNLRRLAHHALDPAAVRDIRRTFVRIFPTSPTAQTIIFAILTGSTGLGTPQNCAVSQGFVAIVLGYAAAAPVGDTGNDRISMGSVAGKGRAHPRRWLECTSF